MLKERVIIKKVGSNLFGKEGIIVATKSFIEGVYLDEKNIVCKVLSGGDISDWIPDRYLERKHQASMLKSSRSIER
ncbi:hypothetical protein [Syntrophomonas curvata]